MDERWLGKLAYQSPELVARQVIDHRSDLFAVGVVLFESLTLKRLFNGDTDLEVLSQIRDADIDQQLSRHPHIPEPIKAILFEPWLGILQIGLGAPRVSGCAAGLSLRDSGAGLPGGLATMLHDLLDVAQPTDEDSGTQTSAPSKKKPITRPTTRPTRRSPGARPQRQSTRPMRLEVLDEQVDGPSTAVTPVLGLQGDAHGSKGSQLQDKEIAPEVLYQGTLEALGVTHFLYRLATRRVTGRLTLDSAEVSKEVAFEETSRSGSELRPSGALWRAPRRA